MSRLKLGFFQRRQNITGHNFLVLSNCCSNNYFDSFDEAKRYATEIRSTLLNAARDKPYYEYYCQGYAVYGWNKKKWYLIERWTY